jgi:uncharacterized protein YkwD
MSNSVDAGRRRLAATAGGLAALGAAALASLALAAGGPGPGPASARGVTGCASAAVPVSESSVKELRKAVRCLVNQERAIHGFGRLNKNKPLQQAAQKHTKTMVATDCLAHRCPDEVDLDTRLEQAGYFDGAKSWRYAENTGCGASAEAMVANWMNSVYHRVNILDPEFRDLGIGASQQRVDGRCKRKYGTFTVVFGVRNAG